MSSDSNLVSPNKQELGRQADDRAEVGLHEDLVVDVLVEAGDDVGVGGERRQNKKSKKRFIRLEDNLTKPSNCFSIELDITLKETPAPPILDPILNWVNGPEQLASLGYYVAFERPESP